MRSHALVLSALIVASAHGQQWVQLPDFPGTARDDAASFSIEGKVYVGTGMEVGWGLTNDWYVFDQATEEWDTIAPLPGTPRQYCSSFVVDGFGYLCAGLDASGPLNELWRYDPVSDTWSQMAPLPAAGRYACVAFTDNTYGFICTGMLDNNTPTNENWRYDVFSNSWTIRAPMPGTPRHRATYMGGVVGGADGSFQALADGYVYWFTDDQWTPVENLPEPRYGAASADNMLLCGASSTAAMHSTVWRYDWLLPDWDTGSIPEFPGGGRRGAVTGLNTYLADAGIIYYGTGLDSSLVRHSDWWRLDYPGGFEEHESGPVIVFPNPGIDHFTVQVQDHSQWILTVTGLTGVPVDITSSAPTDRFNSSPLASGIYLIQIRLQDGSVRTTRWVKL